jgi:hypothetical protein
MKEIKYYIVKVFHHSFEYFKEEGKILEFDTEEAVREALKEIQNRHSNLLLAWKKEEINLE